MAIRPYNRNQSHAGNHMAAIEYVIVGAYIAVLLLLMVYCAHRYHILYLYFRHKNDGPSEPAAPELLPRVTIQLPVYNELYVVERLIRAAAALEYPKELLDIQILDDSTDETALLARKLTDELQGRGLDITYLHRGQRTGFKAGALEAGLKLAKGECLAIFDADFVPQPDFLKRTVPYFADPRIGMVQTRWGHVNRSYSLLTRVAGHTA